MSDAVRVQHFVCTEGIKTEVRTNMRFTIVKRLAGNGASQGVECVLQDSGNGFIARFPASNSTEQDAYACMDYSQARSLVLALSAHAKDLGFAEEKP